MKRIVTGCDENGVFTISTRRVLFILLFALLTAGAQATGTQCKGITKAGVQCKGITQKGSEYCAFHNPANRCAGINAKGERCGAMKMRGSQYCNHHQSQAK